ncbi:RNA-binding protein 45 [Coccinella septempunctata]|uniref:RNA-binding protein 45 n=1 Tax=Coccinella septempunctata TaxID=41139 RepID=UPI001D063741|nr:RNA-binding protein 45 [Coccinella septempunctata]
MSDRRSSDINPPNSRLFVIGCKTLTEKDYWDAFQEFGDIEEVWVVKDRNTGESKGVTYIKYAKTSQAAKALEAMNGTTIGNANRNIKVMVAASKDQGTKRDDKETEDEKTTRLFVKIPKEWTKTELFDAFRNFGNIDYANVIKDRNTNENKGFGFVKFFKFSDAARAFEECDKNFRAVFAEPKHSVVNKKNEDTRFLGFNNSFRDIPSSFRNNSRTDNSLLSTPDVGKRGDFTGLIVSCSPLLRQEEVWRLFDIIPELEYCQLRVFGAGPRPTTAVASVVYNSPKWAAYALEKLHGFEYPLGTPLLIKPDFDSPTSRNRSPHSRNLRNERDYRDTRSTERGSSSSTASSTTDLAKLAETLAQASSLLQAAGISTDLLTNKLTPNIESICNVKLPDVKPLANIDAFVEARCFIVCSPNPPPINILRDIFCRFGNLIDVYLLSGKNCGYAKYSKKESADEAIKTLHGAEICSCRVKVLEAAEQPEIRRKRPRIEDDQ